MNLNDIIQSAQGGGALQNLANQFGLSPEQTQSALQAIIPALSHGLQRTAQDPGALGNIVSEIGSGAHAGSYADPSQTGAAADAGTGALGQIFGSPGGHRPDWPADFPCLRDRPANHRGPVAGGCLHRIGRPVARHAGPGPRGGPEPGRRRVGRRRRAFRIDFIRGPGSARRRPGRRCAIQPLLADQHVPAGRPGLGRPSAGAKRYSAQIAFGGRLHCVVARLAPI